MTNEAHVELGVVQETLFITLAARAKETRKKKPVLRDPKAAEMVAAIGAPAARYERDTGAWINVLRTAIFDFWVRSFLAGHPAGTVVEIGTGLNTRFERVDNGQVHWIDMDMPDTIELRRKFFADSDRRAMLAASVLDDDWLAVVADRPGPYFFVAEGVLVYLAEAPQALARIAARFPGSLIAFDTYGRRSMNAQHRMADKKKMQARWAWTCEDPRSLEPLGLRLLERCPISGPPRAVRRELPARYHVYLPVADLLLHRFSSLNLFRADPTGH